LSLSILIVEDDDSVRKSLLRTLSARGLHPTGASNGMEALQLAVAEPPALIIMDLQLPVMSGCDVVRALRTHNRLASIPVIALSATLADAPAELFVRRLTKPCSTEALLGAIYEVLGEGTNSQHGRS
jgi:CheY-like chemotaxis protein